MVLLTLIGEHQAQAGSRFLYLGPLPDCKDCRLKGVCFNLETGCVYEVTGVRPAQHECAVHEGGARVVEVEKRPFLCSIPVKSAIEGSTVTIEEHRCDNIGCETYVLCHPYGLKPGSKVKIESIEGDIICPSGERLMKALII